MDDKRKQLIKIVPRSAKERVKLIAREKKKIRLAYKEMCNVSF